MPKQPYNLSATDYLLTTESRDRRGTSVAIDRPPIIETAEVIRLDEALWVCDLRTFYSGRHPRNVEIGGPGVSRTGHMMGYMPQLGDRCLIAHPSDEYNPKIITFLPRAGTDGFRAMRKKMRPGDMMMATDDGNYVHVHAGGVVDIASNPITRRLYVPILNQIKDFCENYLLTTAGGSLRWENRRDDIDGPGSKTEVIWDVKEVTELGSVLSLRMGSVDSIKDMPAPTVFHQSIKEVLTGLELARITIDKAGNYRADMNSFTQNVLTNYVMNVTGNYTLAVGGVMALKATGGLVLGNGLPEPAVLGATQLKALQTLLKAMSQFLTDLGGMGAAWGNDSATGALIQNPAITAVTEALGKAVEAASAELQTALARDVKLS